mmetsp:Transcript_37470/g.76563  ORF Transcript_37470/g.76563 Transcript_37470/m.76563 type:complete len:93 (+) Transcript_37470:159-437(+)
MVALRNAKEYGLLLENEGDAAGFLGVDLKKENGQIVMTQTGLIDRIISALGDICPKLTPAKHKRHRRHACRRSLLLLECCWNATLSRWSLSS